MIYADLTARRKLPTPEKESPTHNVTLRYIVGIFKCKFKLSIELAIVPRNLLLLPINPDSRDFISHKKRGPYTEKDVFIQKKGKRKGKMQAKKKTGHVDRVQGCFTF